MNMFETIGSAQAIMQKAAEKVGRQINIMEVCGTHTVSIFRHGIKSILGGEVRLISGPGCPVCVTDQGYIDTVLQLADREDTIIATYGDMMRVPGRSGSLETRQTGGNVHIVFSVEDALELARQNADKTVVFVAVGFETTTPPTAVAIKEAVEQNIENFTILSNHKLVVPAMRALLSEKNHKIDAFLCPGHVSVIIGYGAFAEIVDEYSRPCVVAGFEPLQIIEGLARICTQLEQGRAVLDNVYSAVVSEQGNKFARDMVAEYFEPAGGYWRGLGKIPSSTMKLKDRYRRFDAYERFGVAEGSAEDLTGCRCGEVLCGLIDPPQCQLYASRCTPDAPVGACMVSSEGTCSAWYKYSDTGTA